MSCCVLLSARVAVPLDTLLLRLLLAVLRDEANELCGPSVLLPMPPRPMPAAALGDSPIFEDAAEESCPRDGGGDGPIDEKTELRALSRLQAPPSPSAAAAAAAAAPAAVLPLWYW